jgi:translation initiation factor 5B
LCDIAVLVVDIMHALEPQTIESINLLRMRNTPFVVALNKIDAIYGWQAKPWSSFQESWKRQAQTTKDQFTKLSEQVITGFAEQSLNAILYHENKDIRKFVSLVPTSARTGEGN